MKARGFCWVCGRPSISARSILRVGFLHELLTVWGIILSLVCCPGFRGFTLKTSWQAPICPIANPKLRRFFFLMGISIMLRIFVLWIRGFRCILGWALSFSWSLWRKLAVSAITKLMLIGRFVRGRKSRWTILLWSRCMLIIRFRLLTALSYALGNPRLLILEIW